ncbi:large ribosomal subunit protein uL18m isoform X1 [Petromyzon marinus]|uniref:Large ribosomal subunit protein uL18m n=1 Tax=Petromyzon marinus TaxID=7757 RepID=A0AAJ7WML8_PETMA|nr:39S ribosomal protein L18, mitochondrial isoform X1 [Petromyzon marinus]
MRFAGLCRGLARRVGATLGGGGKDAAAWRDLADAEQRRQFQMAAFTGPTLLRGARSSSGSSFAQPQQQDEEVGTAENEAVRTNFVNRNPRNLERMALALKDRGWDTVWPNRCYWHRLCLDRTQQHVSAWVEHCSRHVVVSASTHEWAIKRHLHSTSDVAAAENVGRVLAQRCLESGISYAVFRHIPWSYKSAAVQSFKKACKEGGLVLSEPRRIFVK